jgi:hypothetical protein
MEEIWTYGIVVIPPTKSKTLWGFWLLHLRETSRGYFLNFARHCQPFKLNLVRVVLLPVLRFAFCELRPVLKDE